MGFGASGGGDFGVDAMVVVVLKRSGCYTAMVDGVQIEGRCDAGWEFEEATSHDRQGLGAHDDEGERMLDEYGVV